jgi:hypothetical protein
MNWLGPVSELIGKITDRVIPDPQKKLEMQLELAKMAQAGELKILDAEVELAKEQIKTNQIEAASPDLFRGGWRPASGWVCVAGFAYMALVRPLLPWVIQVCGGTAPPLPAIDLDMLMVLLGGQLGLGGFRTYERVKGLTK